MGWRGFTGLGCELRAAVNSAMSDTHKAFTHGLLQSWIKPSPCQRQSSLSTLPRNECGAGVLLRPASSLNHNPLRIGTLNAIVRAVAGHKGVDRQVVLDSLR